MKRPAAAWSEKAASLNRKVILLYQPRESRTSGKFLLNLDGIPEELKRRRQWVNWRLEPDEEGNLTKRPYIPGSEQRASTTESDTWHTYEEAVGALEADRYDGIGFVFSSGDKYTGVDLDKCRDPETGKIDKWAKEWIDRFNGYTEVSPSGTGIHIIIKGKTPHNGKKTVDGKTVEIYSLERFFTITGVNP